MTSLKRSILWRRALDWLTTYKPLVIAVTGHTGRTLAATAIEAAVSFVYSVRRTRALTSDPTAVALAILGNQHDPATVSWYTALTKSLTQEIMEREPAVLVLEIPIDRPGDIDWVAGRLSPDITVITDVATHNLELFVSRENSAHEMSSLATATKAHGAIVVSGDDEYVAAMPTVTKARAVSFGTSAAADVHATRITRVTPQGFAVEVKVHQEILELHVPHLSARSQVISALSAVAVMHILQQPLANAAAALHRLTPPPGHGALLAEPNKPRLLDFSAEATPESMKIALETLRALPARRRIAILGDIANLGGQTDRVHRDIGRHAAHVARMIVVVGDHMRGAGAEALKLGVDVHHFERSADAAKWLTDFVTPEDVVLVSGGPEMDLNTIVDRLRA